MQLPKVGSGVSNMKGKGKNYRGSNARAICLVALLSLLTRVSAEDAPAPQLSLPPPLDFPAFAPVPLVSESSPAPSSSMGSPTATLPPNLIPLQPIFTEQVSPTALPAAVPTEPPRGELVGVTGFVYIILFSVADVMPDQYVEAYERRCATFFSERLSSLTDPITDISCSMLEQEILPEDYESRSGLRGRGLQARMAPLLTLMRIDGEISEAAGVPSDINLILRFAVLNDSEGFARAIRFTTGTGPYFTSVEAIDAFDPENFTPPPPSRPPGSDSDYEIYGIDITGLIAIAVGVVASAIIASALTCLVMRRNHRKALAAASPATEEKQDSESEAVEAPVPQEAVVQAIPPPASDKPSVTTEDENTLTEDDIPVSAAPSVMESEGADAVSYAYSLDAGNVESQTAERVAESTLGGDQSTEVSVRPNMTSRLVMAPPGKLGIVIDTTLEGPVVHKVNPGSALEDKVYPGDIIVAIDDVDTRAMSASAITALMVKTANQERRLTVLSEEVGSTMSEA